MIVKVQRSMDGGSVLIYDEAETFTYQGPHHDLRAIRGKIQFWHARLKTNRDGTTNTVFLLRPAPWQDW